MEIFRLVEQNSDLKLLFGNTEVFIPSLFM